MEGCMDSLGDTAASQSSIAKTKTFLGSVCGSFQWPCGPHTVNYFLQPNRYVVSSLKVFCSFLFFLHKIYPTYELATEKETKAPN